MENTDVLQSEVAALEQHKKVIQRCASAFKEHELNKATLSSVCRDVIGKRIQMGRTKRGMTQASLASILGVDRSNVNKWESGTTSPSAVFIVMIANLYNCSADELLGLD